MIYNRLKAVWNPELYHGWGKKNKFFEGWYYKIVSKDQDYAFAFIPGIAMDENGLKQAFIQILDGKKLKSSYIKFSFDEFKPNPSVHDIIIGKNSHIGIGSVVIKNVKRNTKVFGNPSREI